MQQKAKRPLGIKIIIGFHLFNIIMWTIGQGGAVFFMIRLANGDCKIRESSLIRLLLKLTEGLDWQICSQ